MRKNEMTSDTHQAPSPGGEISLVDENNVELVTFAPCDLPLASINDLKDLSEDSIAQFNQLLGSVPGVASLSAARSEHLVVCNLDFDSLIEAKDGAGKLGLARKPSSNQIGEHVRLNKPEDLRSMITTGVVFNIVSTLVAQQHLADINKKLDLIQNGIKEIAAFQKNERKSKITAAHEQIQASMQRLARGAALSDESAQRLSHNLTRLREIALHLKTDFDNSLDELSRMKASNIFGSDTIRENIRKAVEKTGVMHTEYILAMQCLVMTNAILFFHRGFADEFREDAQRYLSELAGPEGVSAKWARYRKNVEIKLGKLHPFFESANSTEANATQVRKAVAKADAKLSEGRTHLEQIATMLFPQKQSRVLLEMEGDKVVGGKYLA